MVDVFRRPSHSTSRPTPAVSTGPTPGVSTEHTSSSLPITPPVTSTPPVTVNATSNNGASYLPDMVIYNISHVSLVAMSSCDLIMRGMCCYNYFADLASHTRRGKCR